MTVGGGGTSLLSLEWGVTLSAWLTWLSSLLFGWSPVERPVGCFAAPRFVPGGYNVTITAFLRASWSRADIRKVDFPGMMVNDDIMIASSSSRVEQRTLYAAPGCSVAYYVHAAVHRRECCILRTACVRISEYRCDSVVRILWLVFGLG